MLSVPIQISEVLHQLEQIHKSARELQLEATRELVSIIFARLMLYRLAFGLTFYEYFNGRRSYTNWKSSESE